jgi:hypothetical protein
MLPGHGYALPNALFGMADRANGLSVSRLAVRGRSDPYNAASAGGHCALLGLLVD